MGYIVISFSNVLRSVTGTAFTTIWSRILTTQDTRLKSCATPAVSRGAKKGEKYHDREIDT